MLTEVALKNNNQVIFNHKKRPTRMSALLVDVKILGCQDKRLMDNGQETRDNGLVDVKTLRF
jgi:hypothetical protein